MGFNIVAIDGGAEKEEPCLWLGADIFLGISRDKNIIERMIEITNGGASGINSAGGDRSAYMGARHARRRRHPSLRWPA
jgi:hypothetical protein